MAVEFRHPSWADEDVFALLAARGLLRHERRPAAVHPAGDCALRLRPPARPDDHHLYGGSYPDDSLARWADRIREWERQGTEVFAYFNNDGGAHAVGNARALRAMLGQ